MNFFDKAMIWLIDKEPAWFSDAISDMQEKMYGDGMSDVEREYKDQLVAGHNPPKPPSLPDYIADETKEIAEIERGRMRAGSSSSKSPYDIINSSGGDSDLRDQLKNGDPEEMFPIKPYRPSGGDDKFSESKIGDMTVGEAKGYVDWAKKTGQVDQDYGRIKKKGQKAG